MGDPATASESSLVASAVEGDEDALTELLRRHTPSMRGQLAAAISSKWQAALDVDDVLQITYLEMFLRIRAFKADAAGTFSGWFARVAHNNLRDAIRELERRKRPPAERRVGGDEFTTAVNLLDELGCTTTTPSRHAARHEVSAAVYGAVDRLPPDYSAVVRLYDLQGLSAAEVASQLQRSEGAVYMLRSRAHDRLREMLAADSRLAGA